MARRRRLDPPFDLAERRAAPCRRAATPAPTCSPPPSDALGEIRKAKTEAKRSMRTEVVRAVVTDTPEIVAALRLAAADLAEAGRVAELVIDEGEPAVAVELAPAD